MQHKTLEIHVQTDGTEPEDSAVLGKVLEDLVNAMLEVIENSDNRIEEST